MFLSYARPSTTIIIRGGVEDIRLAWPRPRTALLRTDPLEAKNKNARGQGRRCKFSQKKNTKEKGLQKKVLGDLKKKVNKKFFQTNSKKRCSKFFFRRSTKLLQFKRSCCPLAEDRAIFEDLWLRGQNLKNVSSRTPLLISTASVEIRQENLLIDGVTNISGNFVEMAGDSRLCGDFVQL